MNGLSRSIQDPAFKSRVHMSLLYSRLDMDAILKLYGVFIKRTKQKQETAGRSSV